MRITGDHQDIGIEIAGNRKAFIDRGRLGGHSKQRRVCALLAMRVGGSAILFKTFSWVCIASQVLTTPVVVEGD